MCICQTCTNVKEVKNFTSFFVNKKLTKYKQNTNIYVENIRYNINALGIQAKRVKSGK